MENKKVLTDENLEQVQGGMESGGTGADEMIQQIMNRQSVNRVPVAPVVNRLEHTVNNLNNVIENTTSAESQIRDTDMASEMVRYKENEMLCNNM